MPEKNLRHFANNDLRIDHASSTHALHRPLLRRLLLLRRHGFLLVSQQGPGTAPWCMDRIHSTYRRCIVAGDTHQALQEDRLGRSLETGATSRSSRSRYTDSRTEVPPDQARILHTTLASSSPLSRAIPNHIQALTEILVKTTPRLYSRGHQRTARFLFT